MKQCTECSVQFEVTDTDKAFLERVSFSFEGQKQLFPEPTQCPACRARRRMAWRNEFKLYKHQCGLCKKDILSMYRPDVKFPVYCSECWWGDSWDAYSFGRDFDFNRPFFEQFSELRDKMPHYDRAILAATMENSDYCNHAGYLKNCYLIVNSDESEQCFYGKGMNRCFDCVDGMKIYECRSCYECVNCTNCDSSTHLINSHNSSDCHFGENLMGCQNCFFSVNLRNKQYHIYNKQVSPEDYKAQVELILKQKTRAELWQEFQKFKQDHLVKWMQEKQTENCTGDYIVQSKDCFECYDVEYLEDSKYCNDLKKGGKISHDNYDISYFGLGVDRSYECSVAGYNANHITFCENVWQSYDVLYSMLCVNGSHDLFGCFGVRKGEYAILNKKYSKEEYEKLANRIVEHMKKTGEWGEFFPIQYSPFSYQTTSAHEHYPMSKEQVQSKGWNWQDEPEPDYSHITKKIEASKAPPDISKIPDEVLNWALICEKSGRLFQIQKSELAFYRRMKLPLPLYHPDIRHGRRIALRTPRTLYKRPCSKCSEQIETTHSTESKQPVYCKKCYLEAIY